MRISKNDMNHVFYKRFCKKCQKLFKPTGKYQEFCLNCRFESNKLRFKNEKVKITKTN